MKKILSCTMLLAVVLLAACTTNIPNGPDSEEHRKDGRTVIRVGIMYDDGELCSIIDSYNADSSEYYVELISYEAYEDPCRQFLLDVSGGNAPDIIEVGQDFPASFLTEKDMLLALDPFFDKDTELKETDLLDNVTGALRTDGTLYYICDSVGLNTLLAKTADVGNRTGWNEEEMMEFLATRPADQKLFQLNSCTEIMGKLFCNNTGQYVDRATGKCRFDTEQFRALLKTAKRGTDIVTEDVPVPTMLQSGEILFYELINSGMMETISSCDIFGEPVTAIGYPSEDKDGTCFIPRHAFGICSQTKHAEGAWDFLRTLLSKEHQERAMVEGGGGSIPTRRDVYERMLSDAQITESYQDEYGYIIEPLSASFSYGDYIISYSALTDEQVKTFTDIFNRTHKVYTRDNAIWNIVSEEASAYYTGEKDLDETAKIIQKRVETYVNESR